MFNASLMGHIEIVKILVEKQLEAGSSLASIVNYQNFDGTTPLMICAAEGHIDVIR
jgi:ankyrin repeat protein